MGVAAVGTPDNSQPRTGTRDAAILRGESRCSHIPTEAIMVQRKGQKQMETKSKGSSKSGSHAGSHKSSSSGSKQQAQQGQSGQKRQQG